MAAYLSTNRNKIGMLFHVNHPMSPFITMVGRALDDGVTSLQVDCDELLHVANILWKNNIPWTSQQRVVTIREPRHIAMILLQWHLVPFTHDVNQLEILTA